MGMIICQTCKEEKAIGEFHCKGLRASPALCKKCFNKATLEYSREYQRRRWKEMPDAKERRKRYNDNPKSKEARKAWGKSEKGIKWRVLEKQRRGPELKAYHKAYAQKPGVKEKDRLYQQRPDVKERKRINARKPERVEYQKKYMGSPGVKERLNGYQRQRAAAAADSYIKELINKRTNGVLKFNDIPTELIEAQRQSLILKRTIKQKQQQNEQHDSTDV